MCVNRFFRAKPAVQDERLESKYERFLNDENMIRKRLNQIMLQNNEVSHYAGKMLAVEQQSDKKHSFKPTGNECRSQKNLKQIIPKESVLKPFEINSAAYDLSKNQKLSQFSLNTQSSFYKVVYPTVHHSRDERNVNVLKTAKNQFKCNPSYRKIKAPVFQTIRNSSTTTNGSLEVKEKCMKTLLYSKNQQALASNESSKLINKNEFQLQYPEESSHSQKTNLFVSNAYNPSFGGKKTYKSVYQIQLKPKVDFEKSKEIQSTCQIANYKNQVGIASDKSVKNIREKN